MKSVHIGWGIKVKDRREKMHLSQQQLAERTGLTQATISRIEKGNQIPSDNAKWRVAGALGCTLDQLFPWPAEMPPVPEQVA